MPTTSFHNLHTQYITNDNGEKTAVILPLAEFEELLAELESEEATRELLEIPGLLTEIEEARKDIEEGRVIPVEQLKRKF